ncbi:lysophospholipase I [Coprinopsis cinerea okayama7|uniref:Acyl-protein thioesterase 1 n=1 Tax=Coprinopsis cinerea (strain Okayama-7 / 130 / ATCC MYA-4618 / FGSC 9003) TaxID=240176 RepID=A8NYP8_COPC7|nr:lysophospholipase I [Coprinopsis cinerea okayama7\|eukprot:XP_001837487.1 lysophospholipase I [Coprinopsis cinerea okayama7\
MAAVRPALRRITLPALSQHTATVIFVHGLGDTGHGWEPVATMFRTDPQFAHIKWILPHSPIRPVTANMGIEMPSWFDIYSFGFNTDEDEKGMLESVSDINALIAEEVNSGLDPSRIILGGFSQGGTMSLLTGLTSERKLGGLVVLSGWLPLRNKFKTMASRHAPSIPIFWGQGSDDTLVQPKFASDSAEFVKKEIGTPVASSQTSPNGLAFKMYRGLAHSANDEELADLKAWIKNVLPTQ